MQCRVSWSGGLTPSIESAFWHEKGNTVGHLFGWGREGAGVKCVNPCANGRRARRAGRQGHRADQDVFIHAAGSVFTLLGDVSRTARTTQKTAQPIAPYSQHKTARGVQSCSGNVCQTQPRDASALPKSLKPTKGTPDPDIPPYITQGVMVCNDHKKCTIRHLGGGCDRGVARNAHGAQPVRGAIQPNV